MKQKFDYNKNNHSTAL